MQTESKEKKAADREAYVTLRAKQLPEAAVRRFWEEFQKDRLNAVLFFDGEISDFAAFCAWLVSPDKDARFVARKTADGTEDLLALYWLNNPFGKSVMIHFCFLRRAFALCEEIGAYTVRGLLFCEKRKGDKERDAERNAGQKTPRQAETYVLSALVGITPKPYRHALAFIRRLGFRIAAELPEACYFARKNKYADAAVSIVTREDFLKSPAAAQMPRILP